MLWFYVITRYNKRTLNPVAKTCGVLSAKNEDSARETVNGMVDENATLDFMQDIADPSKPFDYTVYPSSFGKNGND